MKAKLLLALSAGLAVLLLAGGCFGDGDSNGTTTAPPTTAPGVTTIVPSVPVAPPIPTAAPTTAPPTTAAPVATTTPTPPPGGSLSYTVASGDTLAAIAERFRVSVDDIVAASNLANPDVLNIGQVLTIPTGGSPGGSGAETNVTGTTSPPGERQYIVESGDTLSGIAERFGVSVEAIVEANGLASPDSLSVDYVLIIPPS